MKKLILILSLLLFLRIIDFLPNFLENYNTYRVASGAISNSSIYKFSDLLLTKEKVRSSFFLFKGSAYKNGEKVIIKKNNSFLEFIIFFLLFPLLIYFVCGSKKIGKFDPYHFKKNFKFLIFSFLLILVFKFLLYDVIITPFRLNTSSIVNFLGSESMFGFFSYLVIVSFVTYFFEDFSEFLFTKFPLILLSSFVAGIYFGLVFEEINIITVVYILCSAIAMRYILDFFSFLIFLIFLFKKNFDGDDE